jgi:hypothetical protein
LIRLFFTIANSNIFYQFRDAYISVWKNNISILLQPTNNVAQIIQILNNLKITISINSILRRYYLIRLMDYRNERQNYHKNKRSELSKRAIRRIKESSEIYGRALSLILTNLIARAYLKLKSFPRNRGRSENEY